MHRLKKTTLVTGILVSFSTLCFSAPLGKVDIVFDAQAVATQNTVTSEVFTVKSGGYFGIWYQATAAQGTPDLRITVEMSYTPAAAYFAEPTGMSYIETAYTDTTTKVTSITPPPMPYMRFKVWGKESNTTGTTITMYIFRQE